jgi:putative adhesin
MDVWKVSDELSIDLDAVEKVVVKMVAGELTVTSGPSPHVDVRRESGANVTVELNHGILIVSQPEPDIAPIERIWKYVTEGRRHRCAVAITAPPEAQIDLTTVSADIVASGFAGGSKVKTVSGDVTLSDLTTEVDVKTVSGEVEAKNIAAGLKLKTVSGDIGVAEGACRWVDAKTVSGDVLLDLDLDPSGTYDITTVSGNVAVRTTSEPNLAVDATTVSGRLVTDFGLGWDGHPGRKRVSETIGDGGARLWVKTVSGDLRVLRGRAAA